MLKTMPELMAEIVGNVRRIDAAQAKQELTQNSGLLIDVREPAECANGKVADAVNIPRGILEGKLLEMCKQADMPIYLHCAAGTRATLAAESIMRLGYSNVSVISCKSDVVINTLG
ncbi:rhodanese-like domain-containing protein [Thalassotalea ponticola]|uniref:rhodanese-like domain-containing protein n=1 Tax=Thalassotalea ponticola TaxID=1523392 RepID=UPI0025B359DE|nr:rhodanese-like domain-containing protein [Thalassotalea ponticola]MDN3651255.1 rhodanese-like domain-containing protein [Thalassotalea ponticola]